MNETPNSESVQSQPEVQPEAKVFQQHEINALIGAAKQKGLDKGYQMAKAEFMAQTQPESTIASAPVNPMQNAMMSSDNESRLRQIAAEELAKQRQIEQDKWIAQQNEATGNQILNDLNTKVSAVKEKFEDYDKVVKPGFGNFSKTLEVLLLANKFDNSAEILYDMAKNPGKMAKIAMMERMGMKDEAFSEMKRLSDSIKVNEMSANQPKPKTPLSQVNPSVVGVGKTDGNVSSSDFRGSY